VIGHAPAGDLDQPAAGILGQALPGPLHGRREQRLLNRVLGGGEVPETPDDRTEDPRRQLAQQVLGTGVQGPDRQNKSSGGPLITWRTSIGMLNGAPPGPGAAEARAAISTARSGLSQSTIQ
jgi:hypothetical protein